MTVGPVVTLGESLALLTGSRVGTLDDVDSTFVSTGGAEGNVAIALSRLGTPVTWLGRIGNDSFGRRVVRDLRGQGVTVVEVVDDEARTGLMVKETPRRGRTTVTYYRTGSAGSRLQPSDVDQLPIGSAALLHVSGVTMAISESARAAVLLAVETAVAAGVRVSFDVNHRSRLWSGVAARGHYLDVARHADFVFGGEDEIQLLTGGAATWVELSENGPQPTELIIKRGADGAAVETSESRWEAAAIRIDPVDTVGAGDAFVASYISAALREESIEDRLRKATIAGALACLHPGDWQGSPRESDFDAFAGQDPVSR